MRLSLHWPHWFHRNHSTSPAPQQPPATTPKPPAVPTPVDAHHGNSGFDPAPGTPLTINLMKAEGFTPLERAKLDQAVVLLGKVLNSAEFKGAVLAHRYGGQTRFADDSGMTNEQIYAAIRAGKENFSPDVDHEADLSLLVQNFGFFQRNVVGYTYENTPQITMNRRFFAQYTPAEIAGNMAHEWMHKLGFEHDFNATARRPDSVPYAIGDLVEELAGKI